MESEPSTHSSVVNDFLSEDKCYLCQDTWYALEVVHLRCSMPLVVIDEGREKGKSGPGGCSSSSCVSSMYSTKYNL